MPPPQQASFECNSIGNAPRYVCASFNLFENIGRPTATARRSDSRSLPAASVYVAVGGAPKRAVAAWRFNHERDATSKHLTGVTREIVWWHAKKSIYIGEDALRDDVPNPKHVVQRWVLRLDFDCSLQETLGKAALLKHTNSFQCACRSDSGTRTHFSVLPDCVASSDQRFRIRRGPLHQNTCSCARLRGRVTLPTPIRRPAGTAAARLHETRTYPLVRFRLRLVQLKRALCQQQPGRCNCGRRLHRRQDSSSAASPPEHGS